MERPRKWEAFMRLVVSSYKKIYQTSIKKSPFEALYARKFHTPLSWIQAKDSLILRPNVLQEMEQMVLQIQQNIKTSKD